MLREFQEEIKRLKEQLENQAGGEVIIKEVEEIHEIEEIEEIEEDKEEEDNDDQVSDPLADPEKPKDVKIKGKQSKLDPEIVAELHALLEKEKQAILEQKDIKESEKKKMIEEATVRMQELENEKAKKEQLSRKLQHLQQNLLVGGVNLLDKNQEQKLLLAKKAQELEEVARKERELQRELIDQEETGFQFEEEFTSLQEEASSKTKKLKKLWNSYQNQRSELADLKEEYVRSREGSCLKLMIRFNRNNKRSTKRSWLSPITYR
jgi:kinesin family protein 3/17